MPASSRVAVVTGANKGIGYHVAKQLISSGLFGHVVLACRDATRGTKAASELGGSFLPLDVGDASSRAKFVEELTTKYGRLDCLVNNAATAYKNADPTPSRKHFTLPRSGSKAVVLGPHNLHLRHHLSHIRTSPQA